jgi:hypothetical protein
VLLSGRRPTLQEGAIVYTKSCLHAHLIAVALQTNRPKDRLKIEHLLESGREPLDEELLEVILQKHGLEGRWKKFLAGRG